MGRGLGVVEFFQQTLPDWTALVAGLLTQLGDLWFLGCLLGVLFWKHESDRDDVAFVAVLFAASVVATQVLKYLFGLPRPSGPPDPATTSSLVRPVYEATASASGPGFPSGHATAATAVYGGLAAALSVGTRRRRFAIAAGLVGLVGLTRVLLAHHYVVDVVAGTALGATVVAGGLWARRAKLTQ